MPQSSDTNTLKSARFSDSLSSSPQGSQSLLLSSLQRGRGRFSRDQANQANGKRSAVVPQSRAVLRARLVGTATVPASHEVSSCGSGHGQAESSLLHRKDDRKALFATKRTRPAPAALPAAYVLAAQAKTSVSAKQTCCARRRHANYPTKSLASKLCIPVSSASLQRDSTRPLRASGLLGPADGGSQQDALEKRSSDPTHALGRRAEQQPQSSRLVRLPRPVPRREQPAPSLPERPRVPQAGGSRPALLLRGPSLRSGQPRAGTRCPFPRPSGRALRPRAAGEGAGGTGGKGEKPFRGERKGRWFRRSTHPPRPGTERARGRPTPGAPGRAAAAGV